MLLSSKVLEIRLPVDDVRSPRLRVLIKVVFMKVLIELVFIYKICKGDLKA